jgi:SagB-type dehydrogenase family enzyme
MDNNAVVLAYHERTKHHPHRYAASLGYMDWATQPNPFRRYGGTRVLSLPLSGHEEGTMYHELFASTDAPKPLNLESLAQTLQYALGLAAWKRIGTDRWALRCNASSGNLHPTEGLVILPPMEGVSQQSVIAHYAPKEHALEILAEFDTNFWNTLESPAWILGLSSVLWREVWKYGERAFRYTQLDVGHAKRAVEVAAKLPQWHTCPTEHVRIKDQNRLFGLDQNGRYHPQEREIADLLMILSAHHIDAVDLAPLIHDLPKQFDGQANLLSQAHHHWEVIDQIADATEQITRSESVQSASEAVRKPMSRYAKEVILNRRSAQAMDSRQSHMDKTVFLSLLQSVKASFSSMPAAVDLVVFVHQVDGLEPGLYYVSRMPESLAQIQQLMRDDFLWQPEGPDLYLLESGDFRQQAKFIACSQDIASDSAFSLGMLAKFESELETFGAHRYRTLYWECGAIGQQLYLEATALRFSATGIGCYLDDVMHRLLGLKTMAYQILYHFTVGVAIQDMRLQTDPPYPS